MRQELNTTLGVYRPSFLKIFIERSEDLADLNKLDDIPFAIFFHEYIHFIQDITTVAGLSNISNTVDFIKYCNGVILESPEKTFNIPIIPTPNDKDNVYINMELRKSYLGDSYNSEIQSVKNISKVKVCFEDGKQKLFTDKINITYLNVVDEEKNYCFGNISIMESMAFLCESIVFNNILPAPPKLPYSSAELVIKQLYPELLMDKLNIIALCDASLFMFDAGPFFYEKILLMKAEKWLPQKPEDIYDFCYSNFKVEFQVATDLTSFIRKVGDEAVIQLSSCFNSEYYEDNKHWIKYTIENGICQRLSEPYFILDIIRGGNPKQNPKFSAIFKKFGMPLVTNQKDVLVFHSPIDDQYNLKPDALWVINQIFNIFCDYKPVGKEKRCELKMYCKETCLKLEQDDFTNEKCNDSPWERATEDPVCPFGAMWRTWSLIGFKPKSV